MEYKTYAEFCAKEGFDPTTGKSLHLGRYEGETAQTAYYWDSVCHGMAEDLAVMENGVGEYVGLVEVSQEDREFFAGSPDYLNANVSFALVTQSDSGFISCEMITTEKADKLRERAERLAEEAAEQEESDEDESDVVEAMDNVDEAAESHPDHVINPSRDSTLIRESIETRLVWECREYAVFNKENGLNLGSADEHVHDESLTDEQRQYVADFSKRWEKTDDEYGFEHSPTKADVLLQIADAFPLSDSEWGSERQIAAQNLAFVMAERMGVNVDEFETMKANTSEMLRMLAVKVHATKGYFDPKTADDETD